MWLLRVTDSLGPRQPASARGLSVSCLLTKCGQHTHHEQNLHPCSHRLSCTHLGNLLAQVKANNLQLVLPHLTWARSPAASVPLQHSSHSQQQHQPLQDIWELLTTALGYCTPLDPHLAISMLLSAAAVGGSGSSSNGGSVGPRQSEQV